MSNNPLNLNVELGPQFVITAPAEQLTLEVGIKSSSLFNSGESIVAGGKEAVSLLQAVGVYRAVTYDGFYCNSTALDLPKYAGITLNAASIGDTILVVRDGIITELTWNWIPDQPIFISTNGVLTQTPPSLPIRRVGWAMSATQINLDPQPTIGV